MKRLKDTTGLFLLLLLSLCVLSTPAFAEHPWVDLPPQCGKEGDGPPGPRGGKAEEDVSHGAPQRMLTYSGFIMEISYRLVDLIYGDANTASTVLNPPANDVKPASASRAQ
ncbi:MAG: hypothetical protein JSV52_10350 [Candidatus Zixiibacteriota bacterium]|nr:MAG: hypothetical protein JSV52_10350 [candidate division Zixibacteria bacterium]